MRYFENPDRSTWAELCRRPSFQSEYLEGTVRNIINRVRTSGDDAIKEIAQQFDKVRIENLQVDNKEIEESVSKVSRELKSSIKMAITNIKKFHKAQATPTLEVEIMPGIQCWRKTVPIEKVGIYIPGGTAPLFSTLLMLGIPAMLAGCKDVIVCTPPGPNGEVHDALLFSARECGITKLYKVGGAQAIAAMAHGTQTIPSVYKIFGPGNQYVTKAKQLVNAEGIAIDIPAGPSEVLVVADNSANPDFVAADLLSQAEHGSDSQVVLVSNSHHLIENVQKRLTVQLNELPRKNFAEDALANSLSILMDKQSDITDFVNMYAPEHLIINTEDCKQQSENIINAGSVFLGAYSPESVGDYASGTNHTLPTGGYARAYSGVSLSSFQKFITFQELTKKGLQELGPAVEEMAHAEGLLAHQKAVSIRLK